MANYASGVLVNGQTIVTNEFNNPEQRRQMPSVLELALKNQHVSIPDAQSLRVSPLRPVDVNFMTNIEPGTATAKSYNHTGAVGNSAKVGVVYMQTVETFSLPRKIAYNNIISYTQMFANQYKMAWKNLRTRQDNLALAYLHSVRNQLDATTMQGRLATAGLGDYWDATHSTLVLPAAQEDMFVAQLKTAMLSSYYDGDYDVIADVQLATLFEKYMNQGSGNYSNTSYQFAGCNFVRTQQAIDTNFTHGVALALPAGQFAGLCWNEGLNVKGVFEDEGGPVGMLTTTPDPFGSGAVADVSMYTQRANTSADTYGGSPQDIVDQWELTLTIGYVVPPLALTHDSPVMQVALGE